MDKLIELRHSKDILNRKLDYLQDEIARTPKADFKKLDELKSEFLYVFSSVSRITDQINDILLNQ